MVLPTVSGLATDPAAYLSSENPTTQETSRILSIACPPKRIVDSIRKLLTPAVQSIICHHAPNTKDLRFSPWIVSYWTQLSDLRVAKKKWSDAVLQLEQKRQSLKLSSTEAQLVDDAYNAIVGLPWSGSIQGFVNDIPMHYLSTFVGTGWFSSEHENLMMGLLCRDLMAAGQGTVVEVITETSDFIGKLTHAYQNPGKYGSGYQPFRWLEKLGQDLATGRQKFLASLMNLDSTHWVAVVIDSEQHLLWYGDSLENPIVLSLKSALKWWMFTHFGKEFFIRNLPISSQKDGYSCGLHAWHALSAFLLKRPSALAKPEAMFFERLKVMLQTIDQHHDKVSYLCHI